MKFSVKFIFDSVSNNPVIKAVATAKENIAGPAQLTFKLIDPTGTTIREYGSSPDMEFNNPVIGDSLSVVLAEIPLAFGNEFLIGSYTFYVKELVVDIPEVEESWTEYYCDPAQCENGVTATLEFNLDCNNKYIELRDVTDLKSYTLSSRLLTLISPDIPGVSNQSKQETTNVSIVDNIAYENITYGGSLELNIYKDTTEGDFTLQVLAKVTDIIEEKILCGTKGCEVVECAKQIIVDLSIEACKVMGTNNLKTADRELIDMLAAWLSVYSSAQNCGASEDMDIAISWLEKLTKGRGDCTATVNEDPVPISSETGLGITKQTAWTLVDESDLSNAEYRKAGTTILDQIRYRKLATKHLEIQGGFYYKPDGGSPAANTPILSNFFVGEMANEEYASTRSYDGDWKEQGYMKYKKQSGDSNFSLYFVGLSTFDGDYVTFHLIIPVE